MNISCKIMLGSLIGACVFECANAVQKCIYVRDAPEKQ